MQRPWASVSNMKGRPPPPQLAARSDLKSSDKALLGAKQQVSAPSSPSSGSIPTTRRMRMQTYSMPRLPIVFWPWAARLHGSRRSFRLLQPGCRVELGRRSRLQFVAEFPKLRCCLRHTSGNARLSLDRPNPKGLALVDGADVTEELTTGGPQTPTTGGHGCKDSATNTARVPSRQLPCHQGSCFLGGGATLECTNRIMSVVGVC
mmetsp:Transcript_58526/g.148541  ORF Transcript_58526/g.148541 Transcript_58526/m.148541 type:complete len:205 (-) Transcript_58526:205-819(-)